MEKVFMNSYNTSVTGAVTAVMGIMMAHENTMLEWLEWPGWRNPPVKSPRERCGSGDRSGSLMNCRTQVPTNPNSPKCFISGVVWL